MRLQLSLSIAQALPELFTAGRAGQLHRSSCNPVLAQGGLQTLAVLGGDLLLPWGAVARAEQSSLSPATEAWVLPLSKTLEISKA